MNSSNIFKKLLLAALIASLSGSTILAMDDGKETGQTFTGAADQVHEEDTGQTPADAADQATGEQITDTQTDHKQLCNKISQSSKMQASEIKEIDHTKTSLLLGLLICTLQWLDKAFLIIPGYKGLKNSCCNYFWPYDFSSFPDDVLLNFIFPALITSTEITSTDDIVDKFYNGTKKLINLRLVCKRFYILLSNENIKLILKKAGVDIMCANSQGWTLLHLAVNKNNLPKVKTLIVKALILFGADPNARINNIDDRFNNFSPLHLACMVSCTEVISALKEARADLNAQINFDGSKYHTRTPLWISLNPKNTITVVQRLLAIQALLDTGTIVPESLLQQLIDLGFTRIPDKQIDSDK